MMRRFVSAALAVMLLLAASAMAETVELSGFYGQDIAAAAAEIGGLEYSAGEEFTENYESGQVALRGLEGRVRLIELKQQPGDWALCGVSAGMKRQDVVSLMTGYSMMWEYDEEIAYTIKADAVSEAGSEALIVFFDENGRVNGAWYRAAGQ